MKSNCPNPVFERINSITIEFNSWLISYCQTHESSQPILIYWGLSREQHGIITCILDLSIAACRWNLNLATSNIQRSIEYRLIKQNVACTSKLSTKLNLIKSFLCKIKTTLDLISESCLSKLQRKHLEPCWAFIT